MTEEIKSGDLKPLLVACRCGWQGEDRQLIRANKHERQRYCPGCGRQFTPFTDTTSQRQGDR
jgi:hypothetical protein